MAYDTPKYNLNSVCVWFDGTFLFLNTIDHDKWQSRYVARRNNLLVKTIEFHLTNFYT